MALRMCRNKVAHLIEARKWEEIFQEKWNRVVRCILQRHETSDLLPATRLHL
jgi:hypothetical protein